MTRITVTIAAFAVSVPAYANGAVLVLPEPNPLTLLSLGLAGLLIGRRLAVRKPPKD